MSVRKVVVDKKRKRRLKSTEGLPKLSEYRKGDFLPGNTVWQRRLDSNGQKRMFTDPKALLDEFEKYVCWALANPIPSAKLASEEGLPMVINVPLRRPITISGFCVIIGCNEDYLRNFRNDVRKNPKLGAFGPVIESIYQFVEDNLMEGATVNQFNANIISRKLGLIDRTDVTTNNKELMTAPTFTIINQAPAFAASEGEVDKEKKG